MGTAIVFDTTAVLVQTVRLAGAETLEACGSRMHTTQSFPRVTVSPGERACQGTDHRHGQAPVTAQYRS